MLPSWWVENFGNKPYQIEDCVAGMKKLPDGCVDMFLFDPPFNVDLDYATHSDVMSDKDYSFWMAEVLRQCERLVKNGPIIVFTGDYGVPLIFDAIKTTNLVYQHMLKWYKPHCQCSYRGYMLFNRVELAFLLTKKKPYTHNPKIMHSDTFLYENLTPNNSEINPNDHPCPRPWRMYAQLIAGFSNPGDVVMDCFTGSGTTLLACRVTDRIGLGFEIAPQYEKVIQERMMQKVPKIESWELSGDGKDGHDVRGEPGTASLLPLSLLGHETPVPISPESKGLGNGDSESGEEVAFTTSSASQPLAESVVLPDSPDSPPKLPSPKKEDDIKNEDRWF